MVRAKKNLQYKCTKWKRRLPKNVLTDSVIELTDVNTQKKYPERLRLVRFHDDEQDRDFAFLTNAFHLTSLEIANLYKNRWQIELFFKWLKQHLKIKKFWGTTENAGRIQICSAIITYCLVAIVQHNMQLKRSNYEVLQILSISLTDKTTLRDIGAPDKPCGEAVLMLNTSFSIINQNFAQTYRLIFLQNYRISSEQRSFFTPFL